MAELLDRPLLRHALERLNEILASRDQLADLYVVGGAVMCLVHDARPATKDVDGWFTNPTEVRAAARQVGEELNLPEAWLNDAAKGFVPPNAGYDKWQKMSHLTVATVDDRTLLAMKYAAARSAEDSDDIRFLFLVTRLGLQSSREVLDVVLQYYSADRLPVRTRLLLEEMLDDRA